MFFQNIFWNQKHVVNQFNQERILFCHVIVKNYLCNVLCNFLIKTESTWKREIKEQTPQLTLCCGRTARSSHRRCSIKKSVLKNFVISTGSTCVGVFFKKSCRSEGPNTRVFLYILRNLRKTICFEKHLRTAAFLLFQWFKTNSEMGLKVQGLDCMTASGFRVFRPSYFLFLSRHLPSWTKFRMAFEYLRQISLMSQLRF